MSTKKCPYCGEEIQSDAVKCRYCGEWINEDAKAKELSEIDLRNAVGKILIESGNYLEAVRYYTKETQCDEKEARKYVDRLYGIIKSWEEKGKFTLYCPHCSAPLSIGETQCQNCGSPVTANIPNDYNIKMVKTSWWDRNKGWVIGLIILHVAFVVINIIRSLSHTNHYYY